MLARWTNNWPSLVVMAAATILAAARGCERNHPVNGATRNGGEGARARDAQQSDGPETIQVRPGERLVVRGPSIPVHPMFRDARTEADYDPSLLRLVGNETDATRLGAAAAQLTFEALRPGSGAVVLKVVTSKGAVEKTASYRFEIAGGRRR